VKAQGTKPSHALPGKRVLERARVGVQSNQTMDPCVLVHAFGPSPGQQDRLALPAERAEVHLLSCRQVAVQPPATLCAFA